MKTEKPLPFFLIHYAVAALHREMIPPSNVHTSVSAGSSLASRNEFMIHGELAGLDRTLDLFPESF